ncbi:hypothetical protein CPB86DRAFT_790916 [Serendipita vermifera]|nr:hypothetical protein CPB86DRAFT_790916 [Serendipita vermifera]
MLEALFGDDFSFIGDSWDYIALLQQVFETGKAGFGIATSTKFGPPSLWAMASFSYGAVRIRRFIDEKLYRSTEAGERDWWLWVELASYLGGTAFALYIVIPFLFSIGITPPAAFAIVGGVFIATLFLPSTAMKKMVERAIDWSIKKVTKTLETLRKALKSFCRRNNARKSDEIQDEKNEGREVGEPEEDISAEPTVTGQSKSVLKTVSSAIVEGGQKVVRWLKSWF